jgi:hypothetical protein
MYIGHPSECFNVTGLGSVKLFLLNYLFYYQHRFGTDLLMELLVTEGIIIRPVVSVSALTC